MVKKQIGQPRSRKRAESEAERLVNLRLWADKLGVPHEPWRDAEAAGVLRACCRLTGGVLAYNRGGKSLLNDKLSQSEVGSPDPDDHFHVIQKRCRLHQLIAEMVSQTQSVEQACLAFVGKEIVDGVKNPFFEPSQGKRNTAARRMKRSFYAPRSRDFAEAKKFGLLEGVPSALTGPIIPAARPARSCNDFGTVAIKELDDPRAAPPQVRIAVQAIRAQYLLQRCPTATRAAGPWRVRQSRLDRRSAASLG